MTIQSGKYAVFCIANLLYHETVAALDTNQYSPQPIVSKK
jgi:hypothetical protein